MAIKKFLYWDSTEETYIDQDQSSDSLQLITLDMQGDVTMNSNKVTGLAAGSSSGDALSYDQASAQLSGLTVDTNNLVLANSATITGLPASPSGDTEATSKAYVDAQVTSGTSLKESVVHEDQLDDTEGVLGASLLTMANNPSSGDTIVLTDGTTTRTYGAGTGGDVQYTIGGTVADTMGNFKDAVNGDGSAIWTCVFTTSLDAIDSDGVVVIIEDDNDGVASKIYGTWSTQADCQIVDYTDELNYDKMTTGNLPSSLPSDTNFGIRRTQASLDAGELHYSQHDDVLYGWDDDADTWQTMTGANAIPDATSGSGGGTKGKVTFDSDKGLSVTSGIAEVKIDDTPDTLDVDSDGLKVVGVPSLFKINGTAVGATVTAPNLDDLTDGSNADSLHVHATAVSEKNEKTFTAAETLAAGDPVYHDSTANQVGKALAGTAGKRWVAGLARTAITISTTGPITTSGHCAGVLSGATPGSLRWLGASGGLATSAPGSGNRRVLCGIAQSATDLQVFIQDFGMA